MREKLSEEILESVAGGILSLDYASDGSGALVVQRLDGQRNLLCEYTIADGMAKEVAGVMKNDYGTYGGDEGTLQYLIDNHMINLRQ